MEKDKRLAGIVCPTCYKPLDAALETEGLTVRPMPDDYTICGYCASYLVYTKNPMFQSDLLVRLITPEEVGNMDDVNRKRLATARKDILALFGDLQ